MIKLNSYNAVAFIVIFFLPFDRKIQGKFSSLVL